MMENTNRIYHSPKFQDLLLRLRALEKDRIFCKHDLNHFLSVGRIAYILNLEQGLGLSKDLLYSAALLHDLGRVEQYETGKDHHLASVEIAKEFLKDCDFTEEEQALLLHLIASHRKEGHDPAALLFYRADKLSRPCYFCPARSQCNWPEERKNISLRY